MKRLIKNTFLILLIMVFFSGSAFADSAAASIDDNAEPFKGDGTTENPYTYLINGESRAVWKHLVTIKETGDSELYECHENDDIHKNLLYSFLFHPENLKQTPDGPYYLGLRKYDKEKTQGLPGYDSSLYFSLANKREFPGEVQVTLDVSSTFKEGQNLILMYYGGYDGTVIHGAAPIVMKDEILDVDRSSIIEKDIVVKDGYVKFFVRNGGNFVLTPEELDFSSLEKGDVLHYDSTKVLGTLDGLFTNEKIAEAAAEKIGCNVTDTVTQGDIDTIKSLYLADLDLEHIDELSRTYFYKLESLDVSGNKLEQIDSLSMPNLKSINVSNNRLKSLSFISGLERLKTVDASFNEISILPDFNEFYELLSLDLHENNLKILPPLDKTKLRYLDISGNPDLEVKADLEKIDSVVSVAAAENDNNANAFENRINYKLILGLGLLFLIIIAIIGGLIYTKKRKNGEKRYEK